MSCYLKKCFNFCVLSWFSFSKAFKTGRSLTSVVALRSRRHVEEARAQSDLRPLEGDMQKCRQTEWSIAAFLPIHRECSFYCSVGILMFVCPISVQMSALHLLSRWAAYRRAACWHTTLITWSAELTLCPSLSWSQRFVPFINFLKLSNDTSYWFKVWFISSKWKNWISNWNQDLIEFLIWRWMFAGNKCPLLIILPEMTQQV